MPYSTAFIDDGTGILHVGSGELKGQEIIEVVTNLSGNVPLPERITHGFIDLTAVSVFQVSAEELRTIVKIDKKHSDAIKRVSIAIVAPQDIEFGVSRMYEGMMSTPGWDVQVFRMMSDARAWLASQVHQEV